MQYSNYVIYHKSFMSCFIFQSDQITKSIKFLNATSKPRSSRYKISSLKFNKSVNLITTIGQLTDQTKLYKQRFKEMTIVLRGQSLVTIIFSMWYYVFLFYISLFKYTYKIFLKYIKYKNFISFSDKKKCYQRK